MDLRFTWLALILLPFMVSCSSQVGIAKKTIDLEPNGEPKLQTAQYNFPTIPPEQDGAFHIVGSGDTIKHICAVYGLDLERVVTDK